MPLQWRRTIRSDAMRENDCEWECLPDGGLGLRESMDAAGFAPWLSGPSDHIDPAPAAAIVAVHRPAT
jgi:hypothetical protein